LVHSQSYIRYQPPLTMAKSAHASNKKGTPIGVNDMHIAGHARSQGLILVTNNLREFERIDGLRSENWIVAV